MRAEAIPPSRATSRPVKLSRFRTLTAMLRFLVWKILYSLVPVPLHIRIAFLRGELRSRLTDVPSHIRENLLATDIERTQIDSIALRHYRFSKRMNLMKILPMHFRFNDPELWPISGRQYLDAALAEGKGVLMVTGHVGYARLIPAILRVYGYEAVMVVAGNTKRMSRKEHWNEWLAEGGETRRRVFGPLIDDQFPPYHLFAGLDIRPILDSLRLNKPVGSTADGFRSAQFIELTLLGRSYPFPVGFMKIALMTQVPVLPAFVVDEEEKSKLRLNIHPPLPLNTDADVKTNLAHFARTLEEQLRATPHLWYRWSIEGFFEKAKKISEGIAEDPYTWTRDEGFG